MRFSRFTIFLCTLAAGASAQPADEAVVRQIFSEALAHGTAYMNLQALTEKYPGRLSGSKTLEDAFLWAERTLGGLSPDRVDRLRPPASPAAPTCRPSPCWLSAVPPPLRPAR